MAGIKSPATRPLTLFVRHSTLKMILDLTSNEAELLGEAIKRDIAVKVEWKDEHRKEKDTNDLLDKEINTLLAIDDKIDEARIKE